MKCSFGISNFLEEIPSLSHSVVFLYFFALIAEEGFLLSSGCSLELCIQMFISFLFSFFSHIPFTEAGHDFSFVTLLKPSVQFNSVQSFSCIQLFATP